MTPDQFARVLGLLAVTHDAHQLAALGDFLERAFPRDGATPVLLRYVRRRVREAGAAVSSDSEHRRRLSSFGEGGEGGEGKHP